MDLKGNKSGSGASDTILTMNGKIIVPGHVKAEALVCSENLNFYANVDDSTGDVTDIKCPVYGKNVSGKVLVYPAGCGSTTNCWILYTMGKKGTAPAAIINENLDTIQVIGAVCAEIPMFQVTQGDPVKNICTGDLVEINGDTGEIIVIRHRQ